MAFNLFKANRLVFQTTEGPKEAPKSKEWSPTIPDATNPDDIKNQSKEQAQVLRENISSLQAFKKSIEGDAKEKKDDPYMQILTRYFLEVRIPELERTTPINTKEFGRKLDILKKAHSRNDSVFDGYEYLKNFMTLGASETTLMDTGMTSRLADKYVSDINEYLEIREKSGNPIANQANIREQAENLKKELIALNEKVSDASMNERGPIKKDVVQKMIEIETLRESIKH
ncbi:MAG: hypothetical protein WCT36_04040 [Candidatus Gracilibacteria bacterium]|jgi:hypothetical protein